MADTLGYTQWKAKQEMHDLRLQGVKAQSSVKFTESDQNPNTESHQAVRFGTLLQVNINRADVAEITAKVEGIGRVKAQAIVDYRRAHGQFKRKEDLLQVKGIGEKTLEKIKDRIRIE